jgi:hypothetical protein
VDYTGSGLCQLVGISTVLAVGVAAFVLCSYFCGFCMKYNFSCLCIAISCV